MAHGEHEIDVVDADGRRKAKSPAAPHSDVLGLLKQLHRDPVVAERHLGNLLASSVLRLGLRVACPTCNRHSWFSLRDLDENVTCTWCLRQFAFPTAMPPRDAWAYRTQGPFAIDNYANGAYSVALALRFICNHDRSDATWAPSTEVQLAGERVETDFVVFLRHRPSPKIIPVIGECRSSHQRFTRHDVVKLEQLATALPGCVLAFATFRPALEPAEVRVLRALARRGRRPAANGMWRNPVLVLTEHEMFADEEPPICWKGLPEYNRSVRRKGPEHQFSFICAATQVLHLGDQDAIRDWERYMEPAVI